MKYALIDGIKTEALKKGKGICICCGEETIAKCGNKIVHHWAHKSLKHCDNWWENETEWHREWKSHFHIDLQEVVHFDPLTNEKHIADVKLKNGTVLEFQNSPMEEEELKSRERFYKNLVWIVNGIPFKKNFHILNKLPSPNLSTFSDIFFINAKEKHQGRSFLRYSENPNFSIKKWNSGSMFRMHGLHEISIEIEENYDGHHLYDWVRPRSVWNIAKCPVFFDMGDGQLYKLINNYQEGLKVVRCYSKKSIIKHALK